MLNKLIANTRFLNIFVLVNLIVNINLSAQTIDKITITGNYQNVNLPDFFKEVESKFPVTFYYDVEYFKNQTINQDFNNTSLSDVLDKILKETPYLYDVLQNDAIVFLPKEEVALATGKMDVLTQGFSDINTVVVGNVNELGKYKKLILKGQILSGKNQEPIFGAFVQVKNTKFGASTDKDGLYSINLPAGIYSLLISTIGYDDSYFKIKLVSNGIFNAELAEKSIRIEEVTVSANRADRNVAKNQMSIVEMDKKMIKQLAGSMGTKDVLKSMTMIPGIKSVGEFGSDLNVRGGSGDQNLLLIEGSPVFNTAHVFGFLSVINPDVVSNLTLYKGDIPTRFGERVSSVMEVDLKNENGDKFHSTGGIGLIDSRLTISGPIVKDKLKFVVGGRSTYSDWLLKRVPDINLRNSSARFYDANALLTWNVNNTNKVSLFYYRSYDYFKYSNELNYDYGNNLGSLKWNHSFKNNIYSTLILSFSNYDITKKDILDEYAKSEKYSDLAYKSFKLNFNYPITSKHTLDWGIQAIYYKINPGDLKPLDTLSLVNPLKLNNEQALESAAYLSEKYDINENFSISVGLRYSIYNFLGPKKVFYYQQDAVRSVNSITDTINYTTNENIQNYQGLEPRVSFKYQIDRTSSLKLSYNRLNQYISLVSYTSIPTPDDLWKLSDHNLKPILCDQFAVGFFKNFRHNSVEASVEIYYKKLKNLFEYKNGAKINLNPFIETALIDAEGRNYGIELFLRKNVGKMDGWLSYTYSRTLKKTIGKFPEEIINRNNYYPSNYDKPHDLTIMFTYHFNKRWRLSSNFTYSTGRSVTLPELKYYSGSEWVINYSDRNKYRLPDYHRLDLALSLDESLRIKKKWKGSWSLSVMNVYGRKNAYSVFYSKQSPAADNGYRMYSLYKLYIIGRPIPTLTYNFIF